MSTPISRRRIVAGGAWAVPAVVVAGAAPAIAASATCPVLTGFTVQRTSQYVSVTLQFTGAPFATGVSATLQAAPPNYNPGQINPSSISNTGSVALVIPRTALGPVGQGDFQLTITLSVRPKPCSYTIQFPYNVA